MKYSKYLKPALVKYLSKWPSLDSISDLAGAGLLQLGRTNTSFCREQKIMRCQERKLQQEEREGESFKEINLIWCVHRQSVQVET